MFTFRKPARRTPVLRTPVPRSPGHRSPTLRTRALVLAALGLALAGGAAAQQPIVIKFSHVVTNDTPKGEGALKFKALAEAKTQGRVRVEIYPNSQLYKDREELEALQIGAVQMLAPSVSKFGPLGVRSFEAFDFPYLIPDQKALDHVLDGTVGQGLFAKLEPKGIVGLAYWSNGFKEFSANRPLHTLADFKGLKVRVQSSKVLEANIRALGGIPQVLAFSEVYTALQQGVVDGEENTVSNKFTQKMHEVQKYMTLSDHGVILYAVIVGKRFWEGLPEDIRTALKAAMAEATTYERSIAQQENDRALEKIRAAHTTEIYPLPAAEKALWRKALEPVYQKFTPSVGKDTLEAIERSVAEVSPQTH